MESKQEKTMDLAKLKEPFPHEKISWRVGATNIDRDGKIVWGEVPMGIPLAYIDARDVYERLDEVCGVENWQCDYPQANGKTTCKIGIKLGSEWVWKANGSGDTDVEAAKGAYSDAVKRAAVPWGIGRYLYDVPNIWVELEKKGKSYVIKNPRDAKLIGALEKAEALLRGERITIPDSSPPVIKKAFTELEMDILTKSIDECEDRENFESTKEIARASLERMTGPQKAQITKKIKAKEVEIGNRELDQKMREKV